MPLTLAEKKIILQTVHCTKYLKTSHGTYHLEHNEKDNNWYYKRWDKADVYVGRASVNPNNWKHNLKYELVDKQFSGVVVKIEQIPLSTTLGVYAKVRNNLESCDYAPSKDDGCTIMAATVFYRNGCKRIVPLDCIEEYEGFCDGKETQLICDNLHKFIENSPYIPSDFEENKSDNKISLKHDGTIEIENTYLCINSETGELISLKRYLNLNVNSRTANFSSEKDDEWFYISDAEYDQIMEIMNKQMKKEYGFVPDLSYGENNFDRLVNFANYPFAPEINAFSKFFIYDSDTKKHYFRLHDISIQISENFESEFRQKSDAVPEFIRMCGLPYTPKINRLFLQGHRDFMEYFGIWKAGFRSDKIIEMIMSADTDKLISKIIYGNRCFAYSRDENGEQSVNQVINLFYYIRFLFNIYDENVTSRITCEILKAIDGGLIFDALTYFIDSYNENLLTPAIIKKIGKEGFTRYNHDLLLRIYRDAHPDSEKCYENQVIEYDEKEQELCWQNSGFEFCLPEDTNRLVEIGSKMNICVGHLYRDKAAKKQCTIVYAKKDDIYELCIEVQQTKSNRFKLIQKSAFSNHAPQGKTLEVFKQWCRVKGVI